MLSVKSLTDGHDGKGSKVSKWWKCTKTYVQHVGMVYLSFVPAIASIIMLNAVSLDRDKERFGLGWLHCTSLKNDRVREEKFPQYEPTSIAQQRRCDAAKAVEYATDAV